MISYHKSKTLSVMNLVMYRDLLFAIPILPPLVFVDTLCVLFITLRSVVSAQNL